jgi:hypothetical protein
VSDGEHENEIEKGKEVERMVRREGMGEVRQ